MKVYSGKRAFDPDSTTRGDAFVVVENVVDNTPSDRRPLKHIPYHSPDGFEWGYRGSGPADLALGILADYFEEPPELVLAALRSMWTPRSKAAALHQPFKERFVASEHRDEWQLPGDEIEAWLQTPDIQVRLAELAEEEEELAEIRRLEEEAERADASTTH